MNKIFIIILFLLPFLTGCEKGYDVSEQEEGILVSLYDVSLSINDDSRATPSEIGKLVADNFNIRITNKKTNQQVYDGKYTSQLIKTSVGSYTVEAFYGDNPELAFDAPYYYGIAETEVQTDEISNAVLNCTVGNSLVSVNFVNKDIFDYIYSFYGLKVSVGANSMIIDSQKTDKSVYFKANSDVSLSFVGVLKDSSEEVSYTLDENVKNIFPLQAAKHAIINLCASNVGISIEKLEVKEVSIFKIIPSEWLPKPKITSGGFSNNVISFAETEKKEAFINLNLSSPLQELKFKINSADPRFDELEDRDYFISNAEDKAVIESAFGFDLPEIGTTEANINFSSLIPLMLTDNGTTVESKIEIDAMANNRWSSEGETDASARIFTFTCNKPDFFIYVDEGNCWSREFTINEVTVNTGDEETIKKGLVYQYFDGNEWVECTTRGNVKGRTHQFSERAENISQKNYRVRALYRGVIPSSEIELSLETPQQLPNSGMEEWSYKKLHSDSWINPFDSDTYNVYPWENEINFWDTNNDFTTRNRGTFSNIYNCFPAVSFVKNAHSGTWAVELRNTGNGRGNTEPSNVLEMNKVPGELFTGEIKVTTGGTDAVPSGDHYTINKNREFSVRPSALSFWYKYVPYGIDTFKVLIQLLNNQDGVIIEKQYESSELVNEWNNVIITLDYEEGVVYDKCSKIFICFSSSTAIGNNMPYQKGSYTIWLDKEVSFDSIWFGSILSIDDISLFYDK